MSAEPMKYNFIFSQLAHIYFLGEAERIIVDTKGHSDFGHISGNKLNIPDRALTELDRLRCTVYNIDHACQIVPNGSYKKNTLGEVKRNEAFNGLKLN